MKWLIVCRGSWLTVEAYFPEAQAGAILYYKISCLPAVAAAGQGSKQTDIDESVNDVEVASIVSRNASRTARLWLNPGERETCHKEVVV